MSRCMCALPGCYQRKAHSQGFCLLLFLEGYANFSYFPETIWAHSGITEKDMEQGPENSKEVWAKHPYSRNFWICKPKTAIFLDN